MRWKLLVYVICVLLMTNLVTAFLKLPMNIPPPNILNNNTNLTLGSLTIAGDINMQNNSIYNANWVNVSYVNVTILYGDIIGNLYGNWSGSYNYYNVTDTFNRTEVITLINNANSSMKQYVDTKSQYDNDTRWDINISAFRNESGLLGLNMTYLSTIFTGGGGEVTNASLADEYIPYTNSNKTWNLSGQNISSSNDIGKIWYSGATLMVGR